MEYCDKKKMGGLFIIGGEVSYLYGGLWGNGLVSNCLGVTPGGTSGCFLRIQAAE